MCSAYRKLIYTYVTHFWRRFEDIVLKIILLFLKLFSALDAPRKYVKLAFWAYPRRFLFTNFQVGLKSLHFYKFLGDINVTSLGTICWGPCCKTKHFQMNLFISESRWTYAISKVLGIHLEKFVSLLKVRHNATAFASVSLCSWGNLWRDWQRKLQVNTPSTRNNFFLAGNLGALLHVHQTQLKIFWLLKDVHGASQIFKPQLYHSLLLLIKILSVHSLFSLINKPVKLLSNALNQMDLTYNI